MHWIKHAFAMLAAVMTKLNCPLPPKGPCEAASGANEFRQELNLEVLPVHIRALTLELDELCQELDLLLSKPEYYSRANASYRWAANLGNPHWTDLPVVDKDGMFHFLSTLDRLEQESSSLGLLWSRSVSGVWSWIATGLTGGVSPRDSDSDW